MSTCSNLISELIEINEKQSELDASIVEFSELQNNPNSSARAKGVLLERIYRLKKAILNSPLIKSANEKTRANALMDIDPNLLSAKEWRCILRNYLLASDDNRQLSKKELMYLYETKFNDDSRQEPLKVLREQRDIKMDLPVIFECEPSQIIYNEKELKEAIKNKIEIKAYVGKLFSNIFDVLPLNIEHIYTKFPEGIIKQKTIKLGTGLKNIERFVNAIEQQGGEVCDWANDIMGRPGFAIANQEVSENLVIVTLKVLGFPNGASVREIFERAKELGLELCSPEIGPQLMLQYPDQPVDEVCIIGMEPITDSNGNPSLFFVGHNGGRQWINTSSADPGLRYLPKNDFVFVRASKT